MVTYLNIYQIISNRLKEKKKSVGFNPSIKWDKLILMIKIRNIYLDKRVLFCNNACTLKSILPASDIAKQ